MSEVRDPSGTDRAEMTANNAAVLRLVIRYMTLEDGEHPSPTVRARTITESCAEVTAGVVAALPDSASDRLRQRVMRRIQQREVWHDRYLSHGWRGMFDEDWSSKIGAASPEPEVLAELLKVSRPTILNLRYDIG